MTVQYYKASQLGNERELTEGVKLGTIELGHDEHLGDDDLRPHAFYDLPFLFRDKEHARTVAMVVGDKVLKTMEKAGTRDRDGGVGLPLAPD